MKKILLKIEYDGTRFKGWQIQPQVITVEETLKTVLQQICQCEITIRASSRTDAGVHARGQVATVLVPPQIPLGKLCFSTNSLLPEDISVTEAVEISDEFSARRDNIGKRYIYRIFNGPVDSALHNRFFHCVRAPLDLSKVEAAAAAFLGTHDFRAFRGKGCQQISTIKSVQTVSVNREAIEAGQRVNIVIEGNGFLKNMVRIMVGTLIDIGRGKLSVDTVQRALAAGRREEAGLTAPAKGLVLDSVFFNPDPFGGHGLSEGAVFP